MRVRGGGRIKREVSMKGGRNIEEGWKNSKRRKAGENKEYEI